MTADSPPDRFEFNILDDNVAEKDLFEDKTHDHIAASLFQLIGSSEGGITIGLEGSWGSGKSTVLGLLREKIAVAEGRNSRFFSFDAWAHEGDPLRRIFLESLIQALDPEALDQCIQGVAKEISGRKKSVVVKTLKSASLLGKILSYSALFIPAGAALLGRIDFGKIGLSSSDSINWLLVFSLGCLFAPVLVMPFWCAFSKWRYGEVRLDVFEAESKEDYTQDITEDGERSSIEFEQYFRRIIDLATTNLGVKKLIIVVDNLDRVDPQQAKSIWSTLQTFFQHRSSRRSERGSDLDNLWFIIPYDREGFSLIWKNERSVSESNQASAGSTSQPKVPDISESFLQKCFQVKAEVPPAVMSNWINYLEQCALVALEPWPAQQREQIVSSFQHYHSNFESSPTPRKIRSLINQIGMNGVRWGGTMSAQSICLYSILRSDFTERELRNKLIKGDLPPLEDSIDRQQLISELAGMLFGVSRDRGVQLLLGPLISASLNAGDGEGLRNLITKHGSAFWIGWKAMRASIFPTSTHVEEYRIAFTNALCEAAMDYRPRVYSEIKALISLWRDTSDNWNMSNDGCVNALRNLSIAARDDEEFINWIGVVAAKKLSSIISDLGSDRFNAAALSSIRALLNLSREVEQPISIKRYNNLNLANWNSWVTELASKELLFPEALPSEGVVLELSNQAFSSQNPIDRSYIDSLRKTAALDAKNKHWGDICIKASVFVSSAQREPNVDSVYQLIFELLGRFSGEEQEKLLGVVQADVFWNFVTQEDYTKIRSIDYVAALAFEGDIQEKPNVNSSVKSFWATAKPADQSESIYSHFARINCEYVIWDLARYRKNIAAIDAVRNDSNRDLFHDTHGACNIDDYDWADEDEIKSMAMKFYENGAFDKSIEMISQNPAPYDESLKIFYKYGDSDSRSKIRGIISGMTADQWVNYLRRRDTMISMIEKGDYEYSDAIKVIIVDSLSKKLSDDGFWERLPALLDKAIDIDLMLQKVTTDFFNVIEDKLSDEGFSGLSPFMSPHVRRVSPALITDKLMHWLDSGEWMRINWLTESSLPDELTPTESLSSRVMKNYHHPEITEDHSRLLEELAGIFNIDIAASEGELDTEIDSGAVEDYSTKS